MKKLFIFQSGYGMVRGSSVNYGMDDGYVPDYHTGRRFSSQYQQQQYEQVRIYTTVSIFTFFLFFPSLWFLLSTLSSTYFEFLLRNGIGKTCL